MPEKLANQKNKPSSNAQVWATQMPKSGQLKCPSLGNSNAQVWATQMPKSGQLKCLSLGNSNVQVWEVD
ncbi:hypothetical protein DPMN_156964 [Dreissena polymorpha]|uniref:Uncharacterized protein n=1 Tax=Dreissena polymorpha TaxID=45954 RepID=A0A9D4FRM0_DREPO|nr:hypothetical protein DPMN_156964 [Dreissena polymorpha]